MELHRLKKSDLCRPFKGLVLFILLISAFTLALVLSPGIVRADAFDDANR